MSGKLSERRSKITAANALPGLRCGKDQWADPNANIRRGNYDTSNRTGPQGSRMGFI